MKRVVITGACGFIGTCLSKLLMADDVEVIGIDNLSRPGSELNAAELNDGPFQLHRLDVSHPAKVFDLFARIGQADAVFHLAAQTAVTTSYQNRQKDFWDNAVASFNVIEAVKQYSPDAYCLYASTNKVFGHIEVNRPVSMQQPLAPYTPYGVSKAVGELYFTEYGRRELGLSTCSLRQSCIYGHHQFGVEDQGWMAWFAIANLLGRPITIYGDGAQVRDLLFIDDLIDLYRECWLRRVTGVYPVGGGATNAISLTQGLALIADITGKQFTEVKREANRPGDQPYFVADLAWAGQLGLQWKPKTNVPDGVGVMVDWIVKNQAAIRQLLPPAGGQ
ncbi:MAG: NAD-dependent epimerase/dehydratase family protein [Candidatus Edwardsbacteria bacterium]|nr:NAD-dependent epimerase/dehydratase family protein [Candidatus Edwardsbacteria bacterium]